MWNVMLCGGDLLPAPVFILASPRSGSTLLRVMLAGHSKLFAPPELNLLPFCSLRHRDWQLGTASYSVIDCDQRAGLIEAVMNLTGFDADQSDAWIRSWINCNASVDMMYRLLRTMAAPRRLVDKSTLNASSEETLARSNCISARAQFIHLVRHPHACIDSLQRTYFNHVTPANSMEEAEALWTIPNSNILRFLTNIESRRQLLVRFEDLVANPKRVMSEVSAFLGVEFEPAIIEPYSGARMTEGSPGRFRSVGDPNFGSHTGIEPQLGEKWKEASLPAEVSCASRRLATFLGYDLSGRRLPLAKDKDSQASGKSCVILVVPPMSYRTQSYLRAARKIGLQPVCALDPAYGVPEEVEDYIPISFEQPESSAREVARRASASGAKAVLSIDDGGVEIAALAAAAIGFPHNPAHAVTASNDKYAMRVLFERANVPSPRFRSVLLCEDPRKIANGTSYPVVLKPLYLSGSRGVIRANSPDEFVAAFDRIARLLEQPGTGPDPKSILVEEYIPGVEVSLEGVLTNGKIWPLGLYDKPDPLEGPFFEETILITPSRLPADAQDRIIRCSAEALEAVGLTVGPCQVELRWNENGPWVVELAARTLGGHCSRALPFESSLTLEELVLSHAAGLDTSHFVRASGAHGVMMIPIPSEGILRGVSGVAEAEAVPGVSGVMITHPIGGMVTPLPEGDKYMGFIFANSETPDAVENSLREAHHRLRFELDPITRVRLRIGINESSRIR